MSYKRALIITTVSGFVPQFEMNNVKILQDMGYEVHYAANYNMPVYGDNSRLDNTGIIRHQIDFVRSPIQIRNNIKAYRQLVKLIRNEKFDLVHCHTPMGGVLGRLATKRTKTTPVVYTAHGFHFFNGAACKNWLFYYPIERYLAHYTNVLITINKEDYENAKKFRIRQNGTVKYIKGVGIHTKTDYNVQIDKIEKRYELGIKKDTFLLTSVGELTKRKNHRVILHALKKINNPEITYVICGTGVLEIELKNLVKTLNLEDQVVFAGYRKDISEILKVSDCFVFPSLQEGLSVALLEAMSAGLPVVCSRIRGNTDLIGENKGGYLVEPSDIDAFTQAIKDIFFNEKKRKDFGTYNQTIVKQYDIEEVSNTMEEIYRSFEHY